MRLPQYQGSLRGFSELCKPEILRLLVEVTDKHTHDPCLNGAVHMLKHVALPRVVFERVVLERESRISHVRANIRACKLRNYKSFEKPFRNASLLSISSSIPFPL